MQEEMTRPIMSEETRLRRKELRRRPRMMEWASALGLLVEEDTSWTVVSRGRTTRKGSWADTCDESTATPRPRTSRT